jgi:hypothetical protein
VRRFLMTASLIAAALATSAPAFAQSLSDRIAEIRRQEARREQAPRRQLSTRGRILQALLYTKITVSFDEAPARDVFAYLRTVLDVNLIVRSIDDAPAHGIDLDTPISIEAEQMQALEMLEQVLEQCALSEDCAWQLRKSVLEVGTKSRLSGPAARTVKTYPIEELLFEVPRFTGAPDVRLDGDYLWNYRNGSGYGGQSGGIRPGFRGRANRRYIRNTGGGLPGGGAGGSFGGSSGNNSAPTKEEKAEEVIDLITGAVEPEAWVRYGGEWATIRFLNGSLIVNAPDYIHRQIGGYPTVPPPERPAPQTSPAGSGG